MKTLRIIVALSGLALAACENLTPAQQATITRITDKALAAADRVADAELNKLAPLPSPNKTGTAK